MKKKEETIIDSFFSRFPPCHAIPRVNEALALRTIKLKPPILDLGCGDGIFSFLTFGKDKIDFGLDKNATQVRKAGKIGVYKKVFISKAEKTPFKNGQFKTVISNSVLEHLNDLESVLNEMARILRKEGIFVFTVPTNLVSLHQFWPKFIPGWDKFKRKLFNHINYFGRKEWQKKLAQAGLKTVLVKRTNSKQAIFWADALFPLFWLGSKPWLVNFLQKRKVFEQNKNGATLLIVAKKYELTKN